MFTLITCLTGFLFGNFFAEFRIDQAQECIEKTHNEKQCAKDYGWDSRIPVKD